MLWFDKDCALQLPTCLTPDELHFLIVCLYPLLKELPYEFCKATGPGNTVIISLQIEDYRMKPSASSPFIPYFTPDRLKSYIGRKGKLYIRPLCTIDIPSCTIKSEREV